MKTALYPGSFDPITNGHLDIIKRALNIFDKLYIVISINPQKKTLFSLEERFDILKNVLKDYQNIEIIHNDVLTVQKAKALNATHIVRGLRALHACEPGFRSIHRHRIFYD